MLNFEYSYLLSGRDSPEPAAPPSARKFIISFLRDLLLYDLQHIEAAQSARLLGLVSSQGRRLGCTHSVSFNPLNDNHGEGTERSQERNTNQVLPIWKETLDMKKKYSLMF